MPSSSTIRAAEWVLGGVSVYAAIGAAVAVAFVACGVKRALGFAGPVSLGARLLFLPAALALWPLVLRRWAKARQ